MQFIPRPHQNLALEFLRARKRAALFLDMGLGKTVVTLTRVQELLDDFAVNRALVIAPLRVAQDTWSREAEKWDHLKDLRVARILGTAKERTRALKEDADIYVINRENVPWLVEQQGSKWPFDMVVIDELSSFKSSRSKRWRMLKRVIKLVPYVIGLTGTPAPNGYIDLWPELYLLDGGDRLGYSLGEYRMKYFNPGAHKGHVVYQWILKRGARDAIDRRIKDLCLSMSKDDWLQLPPVMSNTIPVYMSPAERAVYERLRNDLVLPLLNGQITDGSDWDHAVVGGTAATLSGKLLQLANGSVYDDAGDVVHVHDRKLDALEDILDAANGQSVLVFYSYQHDLARIRERFPQTKTLVSAESIAAWNRGEIPLLLAHPASAGHGLNLQAGGHIIVWFGLPWSLELYQQANARLHRMGQEQTVIIHHIICENTMDERVMAALQKKDAVQKDLLTALKEEVVGRA